MRRVKKCKKCSKEFSINDSFCPECGVLIAACLWAITLILVFVILFTVACGSDREIVKTITLVFVILFTVAACGPDSENIPTEYKSALKKAKSYSNMSNMSKARIYDQLTSEYGGKFPADAAQYAIDNLEVDWKENALKKARSYQEMSNMSKAEIYDQLTSEYGAQFTPEEAQYAIDNLE